MSDNFLTNKLITCVGFYSLLDSNSLVMNSKMLPGNVSNFNFFYIFRCRQKVMAEKKFTIHKAPNVLTIQLKRYIFNLTYGVK